MRERIDLDANATTACDARVVEAMLPFFRAASANPSSPHTPGQRARRAVEDAREEVARLAGATADGVVFAASGTEAANLAVFGLARAARQRERTRRRVLVSAVEHPAVFESATALADEGFEVDVIPVDRDARVRLDALAIAPDVALVAVMAANNETGTVEPIEEIAARAAAAGAPLFVDAVQAAGKVPLDFAALGATALALSAHKLHGPKGVGALVLRAREEPTPLLRGGLQEKRRRPGTENVPGIVGFGAAARIAREEPCGERVRGLRDRLEAGLLARVPDAFVNARDVPRTPNTISLTIPGLAAETLVIRLDLEGVSVSTGAACSTGVVRPSRVLLACGLSPAEAASTIRISLSRENTDAEIDHVRELLPKLVADVVTSMHEA